MGVREVAEKINRARGFRGTFCVWAVDRDEAQAVMSTIADVCVSEGLMFSWSVDS